MQTSWLIAACLGLFACGDAAKNATDDDNGPVTGQTAGDNGGAANGGGDSGFQDGDPVDLDGDGQKDDGVAVDEDGDGKVDGVDTDGDGKVDAALPGGSTSSNTGGGNGGSGGAATGGAGSSSAGEDAAVDEPLSCDGVGICDDNFKDTCDAMPDTCPTTQASGIDEPTWDCTGEPPANVYAYATFADGTTVAGANLAPGACVVFFEGAKDLFYAKWFKFGPKTFSQDCTEYDGCICPSSGGVFGNNWDRRLYAFTWDGNESCAKIALIDHDMNAAGGSTNDQAVSNDCRKYLYALHGDGAVAAIAPDGQPAFDLPFSYVAGSLPALKRRLTDFPKVEVSCVEVKGPGVAGARLMASDVKTNAGFKQKK